MNMAIDETWHQQAVGNIHDLLTFRGVKAFGNFGDFSRGIGADADRIQELRAVENAATDKQASGN